MAYREAGLALFCKIGGQRTRVKGRDSLEGKWEPPASSCRAAVCLSQWARVPIGAPLVAMDELKSRQVVFERLN